MPCDMVLFEYDSASLVRFISGTKKNCRRGMCLKVWVSRPPYALVHIISIDGLPCPH
ncbi:hypothetical protein DVH24_039430 [Malus domestica]|uniref:Uncharacterized protein n=1 Tax=Malus domestica TaxID=3750 RepID=A0A498I2R2_MALDO|nr:hypothetical protein DVH24_039430 [Malus domestica]